MFEKLLRLLGISKEKILSESITPEVINKIEPKLPQEETPVLNKTNYPKRDNARLSLEQVMTIMRTIYEPNKHDWMEFEITKKNKLGYHPIQKSSVYTVSNGALLTVKARKALEEIKTFYPELYEEYVYLLQIINDMNCPPCQEMRKIMMVAKQRMEEALGTKSVSVQRYIR